MPLESIPNHFARAVAQFGERPAVSGTEAEWSYAELDRRAQFIAANILARLGNDANPVALLMDHDAPLISAILGVLKAGRMYLCLDPFHPPELISAMLASAGAKLLLTDPANASLANSVSTGQAEVFAIPEIFSTELPESSKQMVSGVDGAWLMFTSGSMGAPKGVWQNHAGMVQEAELYAELTGLVPADRVALLSACGLSAAGATLFATLFQGATLCPFQVRSQGSGRLAEWLHRQRITIFHTVPTIFRQLARAADATQALETIRIIRLGGEPVFRGDVDLYRRLCTDGCQFMQSYSSTETGIITALAMNKQTVLESARVPVGQAVRGVEISLVDENNQPVQHGGEGRIAVRSARLRQGYWRQPELSAERFLPDDRQGDSRIFISNDIGTILPDGALLHLGRADQLVKISGQRVDLSEVESAVLATELAREAVVVALEDEAGGRRLAAFVVPYANADASPPHFRQRLQNRLPGHMIPNDFVLLEQLPQTPAGKIDRRALKLPPKPAAGTGFGRKERPRDFVDTRLARIWETVLGHAPVRRTEDFFELGGTSLQSVEVLLQIEELFGVSLPPSTLVEYNTIEKLAARLVDKAVIPSASPLVTLRAGSGGRPLFLIHSGQGDVASYGLLTRRLPGRPIFGLQSIGLQGEGWPLSSIPVMARRYLPEILAQDPTGPYLLAGTCMGGMVAFELAQMLKRLGKPVALLALVDTLYPHYSYQSRSRWRQIYAALRTPLHQGFRMARWKIIQLLGLSRTPLGLSGFRRLVGHLNGRAVRHYQPEFYAGELTLFITAATKFSHEDPRLMMRQLAQSSRVVSIPGSRSGLFMKPAVDELARHLNHALDVAEGKTAGPVAG